MTIHGVKYRYLVVDGCLNGTGIRVEYEGGYIDPETLGISKELVSRLSKWLRNYEELHYEGYNNDLIIEQLDAEGMAIATALGKEITETKISYYSDAKSTRRMVS